MELKEMMRKYAYTLARVGLNVQKGQPVLVEAAVEGAYFIPVFMEECYRLGASDVIVHYQDLAGMKVSAAYRSDEEIRTLQPWEIQRNQQYLDQGACYVRLEGVNPALMEDVPENQANAIFAHIDAERNIMRRASREKHCQWLIAMIPTKQWADYILPDITEEERFGKLWELILKLCYIDEENDVVKTWQEKKKQKAERGDRMDACHFRSLHYTASNGTDLTVKLTPESFFGFGKRMRTGVEFSPNIPTEEICTTPEKYGTEGVVYASRPLVLGGKKIENFGFRFEKGKVVEVIAEEGKEMLEELVRMDENAGYLGECALVEYHSPISMSGIVYYCTLIDENASCHLALGRGLSSRQPADQAYTFNDSVIHVDFMIGTADMQITGVCEDGREVQVFADGDFVI